MSDMVNAAVSVLSDKFDGADMDFAVRFVIEGEGAILADASGVRADPDQAEQVDLTMTADAETFRGILSGDVNPTGAFMAGNLVIDGDMGLAMKLGAVLS